jgi:transcription elongation factor GreA
MNEKFLISRKKLDSLYKDLKYWENELNNVKKRMGESTSIDNDLRENPEYLQLTQDLQYKIPNKISKINNIINNAKLLDNNYLSFRNSSDKVCIFDEVILEDENEKIYNYIIVGYEEGNLDKGWVSYKAPIISKFFGKSIGYIFEFNNTEYELVEINKDINSYIEFAFT